MRLLDKVVSDLESGKFKGSYIECGNVVKIIFTNGIKINVAKSEWDLYASKIYKAKEKLRIKNGK